jgi:hypothetical protein
MELVRRTSVGTESTDVKTHREDQASGAEARGSAVLCRLRQRGHGGGGMPWSQRARATGGYSPRDRDSLDPIIRSALAPRP